MGFLVYIITISFVLIQAASLIASEHYQADNENGTVDSLDSGGHIRFRREFRFNFTDFENEWNKHSKIGWIIFAVFLSIVFFCCLGVACCFCCPICYLAKRRKNGTRGTVIASPASLPPGSYPQQNKCTVTLKVENLDKDHNGGLYPSLNNGPASVTIVKPSGQQNLDVILPQPHDSNLNLIGSVGTQSKLTNSGSAPSAPPYNMNPNI